MDVQPVEAQAVRAAQALDRPARVGRGEAELRVLLAGRHGGVGVGAHAGDDAHEHGLLAAHEALQAIDVVEVVDHDGAHAGVDRALEVLVGLRVAVQVDARRVDAGGEGVHELAGAGDVAAQALLGDRAQDRRAGEGLGGEDGQRVGPARAELVAVLARARAQRALVDHVGRRAELGGEVAQPAAADDEVAAVVRRARAGRRPPRPRARARRRRRRRSPGPPRPPRAGRGAGEGLGGEDRQGVAPARGQLVAVLARPGAQRPLVDHVGRRAELGREVAQPAAADDEVAAVVHRGARREEVDEVAHPRSSPCDDGRGASRRRPRHRPGQGDADRAGRRARARRERAGRRSRLPRARGRRRDRADDAQPAPRAGRAQPGTPPTELALAFPDGRRVAAPVVRGAAVSTAFYDGRPVPGPHRRGALRRRAVGAPRARRAARRPRRGRGRRRRPSGDAHVRRLAGRRLATPSTARSSTRAASG